MIDFEVSAVEVAHVIEIVGCADVWGDGANVSDHAHMSERAPVAHADTSVI